MRMVTRDGLGERPAEDALVLEVARSRVAHALFATGARVRIGRYQLLQRAGAGGMGAVWSAWDPQLERRVAIKLMHVRSEAARASMLREGQALAKLSHPNIVPIYDVGTLEDQVYLVMEWIAGVTLRAHVARRRDVRVEDVVALYLAAGAGVAAAHRAGIVQRDFKPDNVMLGDDGRVRVVDFGLAHARAGAVAGTPRYMAPEQARGEDVTAAADQFAFGVSLRESLAACGGAPAWITAVIARATALDPMARYPDMAALLAALARDPARVWRRRGALAVAAIAAAATVALSTAAGARAAGRAALDPVCAGAGDELAEVWTPARRATLAAHVGALGPYGAAQAPALVEQLAAYGARWALARRGACVAQHRGELTPALYERGLACLERARQALDTIATSLGRATPERLPAAVLAARDLPVTERCVAAASADPVAPPAREVAARVAAIDADTTRARYLALAADPAALELARTAAREAGEVGYAPLVARAQIALGAALEPAGGAPAVAAYGAAAIAALGGGDDVGFVEAFARRLFVAARGGDPALVPELVAALPFVVAIAQRTGAGGAFARALLYNNAATERLAAGDPRAAIAWLRRARDEAPAAPTGPAAELSVVLGNLAMLVPDRAEREALFAEERAQLERVLGAEHPIVFAVQTRAALFVEDPREAHARLRAICDRYHTLHPQQRDDVVRCHYERAWLAVELDEPADAGRAYRAVVEAADPADPRRATARAELARLAGDPAAALALVEPLARATEAAPQWWSRIAAADAWIVVAAARAQRGDRAGALAAWRAAARVLDAVAQHTSTTTVARRRARVAALTR